MKFYDKKRNLHDSYIKAVLSNIKYFFNNLLDKEYDDFDDDEDDLIDTDIIDEDDEVVL